MSSTRLDIRLDENNIPKSGEEPIKAIDQLAYIHDLVYQNFNNIGDRHRADQEMIKGLKQLKNLLIPQRFIRQMIIKLFQAKIKLVVSMKRLTSQTRSNPMPKHGAIYEVWRIWVGELAWETAMVRAMTKG